MLEQNQIYLDQSYTEKFLYCLVTVTLIYEILISKVGTLWKVAYI